MSGSRVFRRAWVGFIILAASLPYLADWLSTPAGMHYTWILPPYPEDSFGYMAWARQAANGALLFRIKYTALPHAAFLFHPFFLVCGWLSAALSCEIGVVFVFVKAIGIALFFVVFFRYLDFLRIGTMASIAASVLVGVSSGVGGIIQLAGWAGKLPESADMWMPEVSTFWSLTWNPLFPFSLTLLLLSIWLIDRGTREVQPRDLWIGGLATGGMALIHPYSQPLLLAFAAIVIIARRRGKSLGDLARYFGAALPFVVYLALQEKLQPLVARHSGMGTMESPGLAGYALGFGVPLLLLFAGMAIGRLRYLAQSWTLLVWLALSISLAYAPLWFQRKLIFGAQIPLGILAGVAFASIVEKLASTPSRRWKVALAGAVALLPIVTATPLLLLSGERKEVAANADGAYFVSEGMMEGFNFLRSQRRSDDVVFATTQTSRMIPGFAGNTVVWGHWAMSVDGKERANWLAGLFGPQMNLQDPDRAAKFWGNDIRWIFADGEMKQLMEQFPEAFRAILSRADKVYENDAVVIYRRRDS